jgi:hypothetical protein
MFVEGDHFPGDRTVEGEAMPSRSSCAVTRARGPRMAGVEKYFNLGSEQWIIYSDLTSMVLLQLSFSVTESKVV